MTPCIEWTKGKSKAGYGQRSRNGKVLYVHRIAWEEAHGPIPPGKCVLHHCDNRACYNEEYLFLGTRADNSADMARKGRAVTPTKRLTADAVRDIRKRLANGEIARRLAEEYGVCPTNISHIKRGVSWRSA